MIQMGRSIHGMLVLFALPTMPFAHGRAPILSADTTPVARKELGNLRRKAPSFQPAPPPVGAGEKVLATDQGPGRP